MIAFAVLQGPRAASDARARVVAEDGLLPDAVRSDLLLLLTELITNAVRHGNSSADSQVAVTVAATRESVRATVTAYGRTFVWAGRDGRRLESGGGYGLVLVDTLARSWGIHGDRPTTVWFELDVDAEPPTNEVQAQRAWVLPPIVRHFLARDRSGR